MNVCPECDKPTIWRNNGGARGPHADSRYACRCGARFDNPAERERKGGGNLTGLAAKLESIDL